MRTSERAFGMKRDVQDMVGYIMSWVRTDTL